MRTYANGYIHLFVIFLIAALVSACSGASGKPLAGEAVVYVAVPLSGVRADAGQSALGGARLAAEEINNSGGLLGHRLVVLALDDESDSNVALVNVERVGQALKRGERIAGVIGHLDSAPTSAALPHYEEMGLLLITPSAGMRALTHRGHTLFFRVNASDSVQAEVDARFLVEEMNAQRVAVVHAGTEYGSGLAASLVDNLRTLGATTAIQLEVGEGQRDFSELARQIRSSEADTIFFAGNASEAPYLRVGLVEAELNLPMLASDGAFLAATIDEAGAAAEGMYVSALAPSPLMTAGTDWIEAYREVENRDPGPFSINGYMAMQALAAGVRAANSFQGHDVAQAIRELEIGTLLGPIRFSGNGDLVNAQVWIYRVEEGEFRQME